jgi:peptidoglycan/LPS O-acetylase OafA/YrhL
MEHAGSAAPEGASEAPRPLLEGGQTLPAAQADPDRKYIFGLDVIRASAILLVIVSHTKVALMGLGVAGVELFFVLSGYLVGGIFLTEILRAREGFGALLLRFWQRRWARTIPSYLLFFAIWLVLLPPVDMSLLNLASYALFLQNFAWPSDGFYAVSWSLAVEEWFYLLIPGLATILLVATRRPWLSLGATCAFIVVASALIRLIPTITDFKFGMQMVVIYRLDALAIGVLAAMLARQKPGLWRLCARAWPVALLVLVAISYVTIEYRVGMPNWQATLLLSLLPVTSVILLARAVSIRDMGGIAGTSIKKISQWSYSLYLCHFPVLQLLYGIPGYADLPSVGKMLAKLVALGVAILLSAMLYRWFEKPLLTALSPRRPVRKDAVDEASSTATGSLRPHPARAIQDG